MTNSKFYNDEFQENIINSALQSAEIIVPIINNMINPNSIVDIGCGLGAWIRVFQKYGIKKILGIDEKYINVDKLLFDQENFYPIDLKYTFEIEEKFDLAICLEVAEHLPRSCTRGFINSVTNLAPIILFSAAIPGQGGIHHINEQWPDYWQTLFAETGYVMLDPIRPIIWKDQRVAWYYRQNCFLYVEKSVLEEHNKFKEWATMDAQNDMLLIRRQILDTNLSLTYSIKRIPRLVRLAFFRYFKRGN